MTYYIRNIEEAKNLYNYLRNSVKEYGISIPPWRKVKGMPEVEWLLFLDELEHVLFEKCPETVDVNGIRYIATEVFKKLFGHLPKRQRIIKSYERIKDSVGCQGDYPIEPWDEKYLKETVYADEKI